MFGKISSCVSIMILTTSLSSAMSIPFSSDLRDIRCTKEMGLSSKSPEENIPRKNPATNGFTQTKETLGRNLLNLNESALAILSKLANIRLLNLDALRKEQRSMTIPAVKSSSLIIGMDKHGDSGTERLEKNSSVEIPKKLEFKPKKFHCHPIEDVFIPAVDKMVPAYICKLEFRQFILSSERFLEDYKYHLDVTVDEVTFHRLLKSEENSTGNSVANVIPVTLTQHQGDKFYGVERT